MKGTTRNFDYGFIYGLICKDMVWVRFGSFKYGLILEKKWPFIAFMKTSK